MSLPPTGLSSLFWTLSETKTWEGDVSPRACLVDLVNFLNSLAKEMPFLLSSRDAYEKKELSIGIKLKLASSVREQYIRKGPLHFPVYDWGPSLSGLLNHRGEHISWSENKAKQSSPWKFLDFLLDFTISQIWLQISYKYQITGEESKVTLKFTCTCSFSLRMNFPAPFHLLWAWNTHSWSKRTRWEDLGVEDFLLAVSFTTSSKST